MAPAPARAGPASCAPTADGQTGSASRTAATGVQVCQGGDTGVAYQATGGDLTVDLDNDPITGHAVNLSDDGGARNLTLNIGLPSAGYAAAPVLANDSGSNGVKMISSGGTIEFTSYAGGTVAYVGAGSPSFAVNLQTTGSGTITAVAGDTLTNTAGAGLYATSVNGAVSVTANANITAATRALSASASGTGDASAAIGDGVVLATPEAGLYVYSAQGTATATLGSGDTVTTMAAANSVGAIVRSDQTPGVAATTTRLVTGSNTTISTTGNNSAALQALNLGNGLGGVSVIVGDGDQFTTTGQGNVGVYAGTFLVATNTGSGAGDVSVRLGSNDVVTVVAGNGVGGQGGDAGVLAASRGGNVSIDWTGSGGSVTAHEAGGLPTVGVYATTTGAGSSTIATGVGVSVQSDHGDGVSANAQNGAVSINVQGSVTATGGDAIHAYASGSGSVSVTAGSSVNPVTLTAVDPTNDAVYAAAAGNISVTTYGAAAGELYAQANGSGSVAVSANGTLTTSPGQAAIYASAQTGAVSVATNGSLGDTLLAQTNSGNITLSTLGAITAPGTDLAIGAFSNSGDISLVANGALSGGVNLITGGSGTLTATVSGGVTQSQPFDAIFASTSDGANSVSILSGPILATTGGYGVDAFAGGQGSVSVSVAGGVSVSTPTVALYAESTGSTASVTTGAGVTLSAADAANASGIKARSDWASPAPQVTASIVTGADTTVTVTGDTSAGLIAVNNGGGLGGALVQVGAGSAVTVTGDTVAGVIAVDSTLGSSFGATLNGAGTATVQIEGGVAIQVYGGNGHAVVAPINGGVVAGSAGGDVLVQWTGAGGSVAVNGGPGVSTVGIFAANSAGGSGDASVTVTTGVGTAITSNDGIGVLAANANTGAVVVTSNGAISAFASGPGFFGAFGGLLRSGQYAAGILADGAGDAAVVSNGPIAVAGGDGIDAAALGGVAITNTGDIVADQSALSAKAGSAALVISNSADIRGLGSTSLPVIVFGASQGVSLTNQPGGLIRSNGGGLGDLAISAALAPTGAVTLNNLGAIIGRVDLSNASAAAISNSGLWETSGANALPAASSLANSGVIEVAGATSLAHLGTLTNAGTIDLHAASGAAGDSLTVGGLFVGAAGSRLVLDAALGVSGSGGACGALADCLSVGASSGTTSLVIHNTAALSAAGPNPAGILVVTGASHGSNFILDPTSSGYDSRTRLLDFGLFSYALGYDSVAGQERLYGLPNGSAFQLPVLLTAAQTLWYDIEPWSDRQADFHDRFAAGADATRGDGAQVWLQVVGEETQREASAAYTVAQTGDVYRFGTGYDQHTGGLVGGADAAIQPGLKAGDRLLVGASAGILSSQVAFAQGGGRADYEGALVGVYGGYLVDGLFVNLSLNADLMTLKVNDPAAGVSAKPNLATLGGRIDLGRRWRLAGRFYWEPVASLAAVSTRIDAATLGSTFADFGSGQASGRAALGLRVGADARAMGAALVSWSMTARAWDSYGADNRAILTAGGAIAPVSDRLDGVIGDVSGRLAIQGENSAWSASLGAGVKFKSGYTSENLLAALRYRW